MPDITAAAYGPLFGPDFVEISVNDNTGIQYQVQVYPDANNEALREAGLPTQYYWQPARVYLAKKQDAPADFDFTMTVFKGLMTTETSVGVSDSQTSSGDVEAGGGFCAFSTTFAVPESVVANTIKALKARNHPAPVARLMQFFNYQPSDPDPVLGVVSITGSDVTIAIPDLVAAAGNTKAPMFISAQGAGKGSIEAQGFSSFLITCNELAAGAIAGTLKDGNAAPFVVKCDLQEQFYINGVNVTVTVDADKSYDQFSAALSVGGFLGIDSGTFNYAYSNMLTSGAITTVYSGNDGVLSDAMKKMIEEQVDEMRKAALEAIKKEIFDWNPTQDTPATADRSGFSSLFGGASVSLKDSYQHRGLKFSQTLILNETITLHSVIQGDLNDLQPAVKANLDKYLAIVDIGQFFKKIQVAGVSSVNFGEKAPDGTDLRDPIQSVQMQVSYPDFDASLANNQVNLTTQANGFHYIMGHKDPNGPGELAVWTKDNPNDIINIAFLRLDKAIPQWDTDQVQITTTIVYDPEDPRVDLSNNTSVYTSVYTGKDHAPKLSPGQAGYVFVRFTPHPKLPDNVTLTLTCTLGARTDTLTINKANQANALWEIFSDKYVNEAGFQYTLAVEVDGPNFTDPVIQWQTAQPITVPLPVGRIKYLRDFSLTIPPIPSDQKATVNDYIKNFGKA